MSKKLSLFSIVLASIVDASILPVLGADWYDRELNRLQESAKLGAEYKVWWFNTHRLFWTSKGFTSLDHLAAETYHKLIDIVKNALQEYYGKVREKGARHGDTEKGGHGERSSHRVPASSRLRVKLFSQLLTYLDT